VTNPQISEPSSDDKLWGGLSYVGFMCCLIPTIVIFLLKKDESAYIKFNSLQALGYGLASWVIHIAFLILSQIPVLGFFSGLVWFLVMIGLFGYWVYLMVMAFTGKDIRIPYLADFIDQNLMG